MNRWIVAAAVVAVAGLLAGCNSAAIPQGNYGSIAGTITSTRGQPVAGAIVQVDYGPTGTSGPDGKYIVNTVPVSPQTATAYVSVTPPSGYQTPPALNNVIVQVGQTTQNVNFVLSPG